MDYYLTQDILQSQWTEYILGSWGQRSKGHICIWEIAFWFVNLLYDGGIIFDCAQSKFHLVSNCSFPHLHIIKLFKIKGITRGSVWAVLLGADPGGSGPCPPPPPPRKKEREREREKGKGKRRERERGDKGKERRGRTKEKRGKRRRPGEGGGGTQSALPPSCYLPTPPPPPRQKIKEKEGEGKKRGDKGKEKKEKKGDISCNFHANKLPLPPGASLDLFSGGV